MVKDEIENNNSTSHYQVPTRRYQDQRLPRADASLASSQIHRDLGSKLKPSPGNVKYNQAGVKQSLRKTAL